MLTLYLVACVRQGARDPEASQGEGDQRRGPVPLQQGVHQRSLQNQNQPGRDQFRDIYYTK